MAVEVWLTTSCDRPSVHRPAVNRAARDTPGSLCVAEGTALALPIRQSWAHLLTREAVVAGVSHRTLTVEPRAGTKGKADQQSTCRAQDRESVSQALERIRIAARQKRKERFTSLFHHIGIELLGTAFSELRRDAAAGVDGLTWQGYERDLERNLEDLHARVQRGAYRALPSQRRYIPKADGRQRPLAVAALEDKIVQRATVAVLNSIYEEDFLGFCVLQRHKERRGEGGKSCRKAA